MDIRSYLKRIKYNGSLSPTTETLSSVHLAHMVSVPFENLDIHLGNPIKLDLEAIFEKIVKHRRGGFCYELNGLFAWLLVELGFQVTLLSARDAQEDGRLGSEFDHLTLQVTCPADLLLPSWPWLADVGWGDSFKQPLRLDKLQVKQTDGSRVYRIDQNNGFYMLRRQNHDGSWESQYRFTLLPRAFTDFAEMCRYHQTSPQSSFTQRRICTLATPDGRITLSERQLITTNDGHKEKRTISPDEYQLILEDKFGIKIGQDERNFL